MKTFEKGNNFAVASGGLFILSIVFGILSILREKVDVENCILRISESNTLTTILTALFIFLPCAIIGIRLINAKIDLGIKISSLLIAIGYLVIRIFCQIYDQYIMGDFFDFMEPRTWGISFGVLIMILFQIIPWVMLFIVSLQCNKTNEPTKNSSLGVLCFIPAGSYFIFSIMVQLFFTGGSVLLIIINIAGILVTTAALALLGVWIHVNTRNEQTVSSTAKQYGAQNSPQQGGNQQYYQQPYSAQYTPQYNPQTGVQQPVPGQQYYQQQYPQQAYTQQQYPQQQYYSEPGYQQPATPQQRSDASSEAEAIKTYKELLDNGMITQEEYELKKKQILGI